MCGIAEVLINMGYQVSGSDIYESRSVQRLRKLGAQVYIGHKKKNLNNPHVLVVSSAIPKNNIEIVSARKKSIPVIPRAEMLTELMRLKYALCVAGTHGKTTTTSMIGLILSQAGMDPTVVIGGRFRNLESNAKLGDGKFMVAEADESDGSFLHLTPTISIITNIDNDHLDYYQNMDNLKNTFIEFLNKVPFYGFSVVCGDDKNLRDILPVLNKPYKTYGLGDNNHYIAKDIRLYPEKSIYIVEKKETKLGELIINCTGKHNIINSLAACVTALEIGIDFRTIKKALWQYKGVGRRLEKYGEINGIIFYDDYAHHPTEIALSLKSLREIYPDRRLVVIFQPHRYTRTRDLYKEFPSSLEIADIVCITDIYGAGEKPIEGISSSIIINEFEDKNKVKFIPKLFDIPAAVKEVIIPGDICVTLGAGNIYQIADEIIKGQSQSRPCNISKVK